jgi:predicted DCC family thiol-disulfide oxidoreductase YuxK
LVQVSRLPLISHVLRWGYTLFARNRLRLTGRCKSNRCEGSWFPRPARP